LAGTTANHEFSFYPGDFVGVFYCEADTLFEAKDIRILGEGEETDFEILSPAKIKRP
jgi:hypothetical protein